MISYKPQVVSEKSNVKGQTCLPAGRRETEKYGTISLDIENEITIYLVQIRLK